MFNFFNVSLFSVVGPIVRLVLNRCLRPVRTAAAALSLGSICDVCVPSILAQQLFPLTVCVHRPNEKKRDRGAFILKVMRCYHQARNSERNMCVFPPHSYLRTLVSRSPIPSHLKWIDMTTDLIFFMSLLCLMARCTINKKKERIISCSMLATIIHDSNATSQRQGTYKKKVHSTRREEHLSRILF